MSYSWGEDTFGRKYENKRVKDLDSRAKSSDKRDSPCLSFRWCSAALIKLFDIRKIIADLQQIWPRHQTTAFESPQLRWFMVENMAEKTTTLRNSE